MSMSGSRSRETTNQTQNQTQTRALSDRARGMFDSELERMRGMQYDPVGSADIAQFSNPFQSDVIDATMGRLGQERAVARNQMASGLAQSGAFGDKRRGVLEAEMEGEMDRNTASTLAGLNSANFSQALQAAMAQGQGRNTFAQNNQQLIAQLLGGAYGQEGTTQMQGTQSGTRRGSGMNFGASFSDRFGFGG